MKLTIIIILLVIPFICCIHIFPNAIEQNQLATHTSQVVILVEISIGELIDKITILEIKSVHIQDEKKLENVLHELKILQTTLNRITLPKEVESLKNELKKINQTLWDIEDAIRLKELKKEFDAEFIGLARNVYTTNDARARIKKVINELTGSHIIEEKSYQEYLIT